MLFMPLDIIAPPDPVPVVEAGLSAAAKAGIALVVVVVIVAAIFLIRGLKK